MVSGDQCPKCFRGRLFVESSKPRGHVRVRYLKCDHCRRPAGKEIVPESSIRRRDFLN